MCYAREFENLLIAYFKALGYEVDLISNYQEEKVFESIIYKVIFRVSDRKEMIRTEVSLTQLLGFLFLRGGK